MHAQRPVGRARHADRRIRKRHSRPLANRFFPSRWARFLSANFARYVSHRARLPLGSAAAVVLLQKTMLSIEGVGRELDPQINIWDTAKPFLENWARKQYGPARALRAVRRQLPDWLSLLDDLPAVVRAAVASGRETERLKAEIAAIKKRDESKPLLRSSPPSLSRRAGFGRGDESRLLSSRAKANSRAAKRISSPPNGGRAHPRCRIKIIGIKSRRRQNRRSRARRYRRQRPFRQRTRSRDRRRARRLRRPFAQRCRRRFAAAFCARRIFIRRRFARRRDFESQSAARDLPPGATVGTASPRRRALLCRSPSAPARRFDARQCRQPNRQNAARRLRRFAARRGRAASARARRRHLRDSRCGTIPARYRARAARDRMRRRSRRCRRRRARARRAASRAAGGDRARFGRRDGRGLPHRVGRAHSIRKQARARFRFLRAAARRLCRSANRKRTNPANRRRAARGEVARAARGADRFAPRFADSSARQKRRARRGFAGARNRDADFAACRNRARRRVGCRRRARAGGDGAIWIVVSANAVAAFFARKTAAPDIVIAVGEQTARALLVSESTPSRAGATPPRCCECRNCEARKSARKPSPSSAANPKAKAFRRRFARSCAIAGRGFSRCRCIAARRTRKMRRARRS